jgi:exosortase A
MRARFVMHLLRKQHVGAAHGLANARGRALASVALPIAVVSIIFPETARSMVDTWLRSGTFAHGFAVVPIALYLAWLQGERLAGVPARPTIAGAAVLALLGMFWLLSEAASVISVAQFAVVGMVPALVMTLVGRDWVKRLAFSYAFLVFCVPFGEALVPTMIDWTADFLVASLRVSGVPVYRQGNMLAIPSGTWSVVDACSGVRYLIASLMTGVLFAHLMYRSRVRVALFIMLSIAVPIVANWLRAYGIVMLGHLSDNRIAAGVDHLIYGWLFFAFVVYVLFLIGVRWRDTAVREEGSIGMVAAGSTQAVTATRRVAPVAVVAIAAILPWRLVASAIVPTSDAGLVAIPQLGPVEGWRVVSDPHDIWVPRLQGERAVLNQVFAHSGGQRVGIVIALFRDQRQGAELVGSGNAVAPAESGRWISLAEGTTEGTGRYGTANFVELAGPEGQRLVWHWYWLGTMVTTSAIRAKLELAAARLQGRSDGSAWVLVYTDMQDRARAQATLATFMEAMGGAIDAALTEAAR